MDLAAMVGMPGEALRVSRGEWLASLTAVVSQAFAMHYERNEFYRAQCEAAGVTPRDIRQASDLWRIPLLPVELFKQTAAHTLLTCSLADVENEIRSTGTSGRPSVSRRDSLTVTRAATGIFGSYRDFLGISSGAGLFVCPSTAEVPEMGMVKIFNLLAGLFDDHRYLVRDYTFDPAEALSVLEGWEGRMTRHIVGPPFLIARLLRFAEKNGRAMPLDPESMVVMLGGWKQYTGTAISREEFDAAVTRVFGITPDRIRDMYGMIESNMLAIECEHHRKHVPPWCYVSIRDIADSSRELEPGKVGGVAVLDALNTSYPGFLLSDDIGEIDETDCECGRTGQSVRFHRRREGAELGCCAVSIEKFLASKEIVAECAVDAMADTAGRE